MILSASQFGSRSYCNWSGSCRTRSFIFRNFASLQVEARELPDLVRQLAVVLWEILELVPELPDQVRKLPELVRELRQMPDVVPELQDQV